MNFFKKPTVAAIIAIVLVAVSTFASVNIKLGSKCDEVKDIFYSGLQYDGKFHPPIADQVRNTCAAANDLCIIASNYGIDTTDVTDSCEWVEMALAYSAYDQHYIYYEYAQLRTAIKTMVDKLAHQSLSERHQALLNDYEKQLTEFEHNIDTAGYNEEVRAFLMKYDRFPTNFIASMCNVRLPEYFA